jgi:hypothetical protein
MLTCQSCSKGRRRKGCVLEKLGSVVELCSSQILIHLLDTLALDITRSSPVELTALENDSDIVLVIPRSLLGGLDHFRYHNIGKDQMGKVVDSIVVSESIIGEAERSDSDTCAQVEDIQSGEGGSEVLSGRDQLGQGS